MRLIDADALDYELGISDRDIYVRECLQDAPTVQVEPHWIPVTKRLPDAYEGVLLTYKDEVTIGWHYNGAGAGWAIYEGEMSAGEGEVTAWMPLPEVYKGVTE